MNVKTDSNEQNIVLSILTRKNQRTCWQFDLNFVPDFSIYLVKKQRTLRKSTQCTNRKEKKVLNL